MRSQWRLIERVERLVPTLVVELLEDAYAVDVRRQMEVVFWSIKFGNLLLKDLGNQRPAPNFPAMLDMIAAMAQKWAGKKAAS